MSRVIHFEIPVHDPDRAAAFYAKAFGWRFEKWPGPTDYWMVSTGDDKVPGINGGMLRKPGPVAGTTNTIGVADVDRSIDAVKAAGGNVVAPKMPIPTIGYFAYLQDTEGNVFGVMQFDSNAR